MTKNVLIIEDDLGVALHLAGLLETAGATIVGLTTDLGTACAIAEGESVDCTAIATRSAHRKTADDLIACLGIPSMQLG